MICLAPRAPGDSVRPRRLSGVVVRPLNFTVRCRREAPAQGSPRNDYGHPCRHDVGLVVSFKHNLQLTRSSKFTYPKYGRVQLPRFFRFHYAIPRLGT